MRLSPPPGAPLRRPEPSDEREWQTRKIDSLSLMAGRVAHDFNNLLMTILGNTDLAMSTVGGMLPELRGYLEEIHGASDRAADVCRRLLAFSGKGRSPLQVVHLDDVIGRMYEILVLTAGDRARLERELRDALPPILGNAEELQQMLIELVRNAGEAVREGRGTVRIATGEVGPGDPEIEEAQGAPLQPGLRYVFVEIADDGAGMDHETRLNAFDPFFTTKGPGRGFGLTRVFGIVRAHNGRVHAASELGAGTRVRVFLPICADAWGDLES